MKHLVFINPLKPGKLKEYKAFAAQITGPGREEYNDMLRRYGHLHTRVYYHNLGGREFVIVIHDSEDDVEARLAKFTTSAHPYDRWFMQQLNHLHDFDIEAGKSELLFVYKTK